MKIGIIIAASFIFVILANPFFVKAQDLNDVRELTEDELMQDLGSFFQFNGNKVKELIEDELYPSLQQNFLFKSNNGKLNQRETRKAQRIYLTLTKTGKQFLNGLFELKLEYIKNGRSEGFILVNSGVRSRQYFRKGKDSRRGSFEPLPEGRWYIYDILWKGGKNVYDGVSWGEGLGAVKIPLGYVSPNDTSRAAILIHLDANASYSPGTAGCVGVRSVADFKRLVGWLRETDPRDLYVDWELGSVRLPK